MRLFILLFLLPYDIICLPIFLVHSLLRLVCIYCQRFKILVLYAIDYNTRVLHRYFLSHVYPRVYTQFAACVNRRAVASNSQHTPIFCCI